MLQCTNLNGLLSMERAAIRCHLDALVVVAQPHERREAVRTFIEGYGGLMKTMYCSHVCPDRSRCGLAQYRRPEEAVLPRQAI